MFPELAFLFVTCIIKLTSKYVRTFPFFTYFYNKLNYTEKSLLKY